MAVFYTIGNLNLDTVELVAKAVKESEPQSIIHKVVILDSPESERLQNEQIAIYRKYFGDIIREGIRINSDGGIDTSKLLYMFANDDEKIVDLSNGQKATSSLLFMAASLCRIDRIYYLLLKTSPSQSMVRGRDYEYIRMKKVDCIGQLAKVSYFDLIYYNEELCRLFTVQERTEDGPLKILYDGLCSGIKEFFSDVNYRSVVDNVTIGNANIINSLIEYIQVDEECKNFCQKYKIVVSDKKDPVGILTYFSRRYVEFGLKKEILKLSTVPNLIASLREYRNIAAHYSENDIELTEDQGRIVINLCIEVIKCIHANPDFWEFLKRGRGRSCILQ